MRIPFISLIAGGALALGGCAYGGLGLGGGYGSPYYSSGYGSPYYSNYYGYPRSGISIGVGYGSGYGGYGSPYYGGYGYGSPYYGWNSGYYYPGTGYYVYDSYRRAYPMTMTQRQYWSKRSPALSTTRTTTRTAVKPNWSAFTQRQADRKTARAQRATAREERRATRRDNR